MEKQVISRTAAREYLMQMIFQMEAQNSFNSDSIHSFIEFNIEEDDRVALEYIKTAGNAFLENKDEIDKLIEQYSKGWKLSRLAKVDLAVMRVCIAESMYMPEGSKTPVGAAISEAVRIVKKYDTSDSGKFVNGILGEIARR